MGTATIRQVISDASIEEQREPALRRHFEARLADLENRLVLPEDQPVDALEHFSRRYIDYVPEFLDQVREQARARGAEDQVNAFLNMAEDFFLAPPDAIDGCSGLQALMDEAFLAQRLIEEINDRFMRSHGEPLVDVDMTRANIIAHHLVGEPLASRLEGLVAQSVEMLASRSGLFEPLVVKPVTPPTTHLDLPCMSQDVAVGLKLEAQEGASSEDQDSGLSG